MLILFLKNSITPICVRTWLLYGSRIMINLTNQHQEKVCPDSQTEKNKEYSQSPSLTLYFWFKNILLVEFSDSNYAFSFYFHYFVNLHFLIVYLPYSTLNFIRYFFSVKNWWFDIYNNFFELINFSPPRGINMQIAHTRWAH